MIRSTNTDLRDRVLRLAIETKLGPRTVARVLGGASVRSSTRHAVEVAARRLNITLPAVAT